MPNKIALNGFGRLGRLALMAQTLPLMPPQASKVFEEGLASLQNVVNDADRRNMRIRMYPTDDSKVFKLKPNDATVTDAFVDGNLPKERYHDRTFPKDYIKKKKAKRRNQNQARRRSR